MNKSILIGRLTKDPDVKYTQDKLAVAHFTLAVDRKGKDKTADFIACVSFGKTAEFMGIHTNTVQYRLKKINEILGAEITGNRVIPGLTIALALQRLEEAVKQ